MYSIQCIVYSVLCTMYSTQCIMYSVLCTMSSMLNTFTTYAVYSLIIFNIVIIDTTGWHIITVMQLYDVFPTVFKSTPTDTRLLTINH